MDIPFLGEAFAVLSACFYGFSSVAIIKNAEHGHTNNGAYLSVLLTALLSGGLWLLIGPALPPLGGALWQGLAYFVLAGLLANIFGRVLMFRSVELLGALENGILRRLIPVFAAILAVVVLGERITASIGIGFVLVFSAVAAVVLTSRMPVPAKANVKVRAPGDLRTGRILGVVSSASYGGSYVSRKLALEAVPDPLLGTFIGAVTGLVCGRLTARFTRRGALEYRSLLEWPPLWQFIAAAAVSAGQVSQFFALRYTTVTAVAIIGTIELFIAAWLSVLLLKSERKPGLGFALASLLAAAGTIVIALG